MGAATELGNEQATRDRAPAEVPALAPEPPRRTREETARLATEAVRATQRARHGWTWALRSWVSSVLRRLGVRR